MLPKLLLEYTGTLLICCTILFTNANPLIVGLAYTTALYIGHTDGHFSPLGVLIQFGLKRLTLDDSIKLWTAQILAAISVIIFYIPFKMDSGL
jgi:hypothetical protein